MRTVLFRMPRRNELHLDSQSCPPGTQTRKTRWPFRTKTIVHTDNSRNSITAQNLHKHSAYAPPLLVGQQSDRQNVTAKQIPDRQRFDPSPISRSKPAFEIHGPNMIAASGFGQSAMIQSRTARRTPLAATAGQFPSLQPPRYRPHSRNIPTGKMTTQMRPDLPGSPASMPTAHAPDPAQPHSSRKPRRNSRPACPILQSSASFDQKTFHPFMTRFPANAKNPACLGKGILVHQHYFYEAPARLYQRNRFPGHAPEKPTNPIPKCNLCLCPQV